MSGISTSDRAGKRGFGGWLRTLPRWQQFMLAASVVAVVGGGVATLIGGGAAESVPPTGTGAGGQGNLIGNTFVPGTGPGGTPTTPQPAPEPTSKGIFRLGFSFLAGFCVGTFIRSMLKVASIAVGFWLFMTFVLAYFGLVNVDWNAIQSVWDRFAANVEQEWGSFQQFMTGSLPAAGLAVLGLTVSLKRR